MLKIVIFLCCSLAFINLDAQLYKDAKADVEDRVEDLLRRMTLEEKVAQMNMDAMGVYEQLPLGVGESFYRCGRNSPSVGRSEKVCPGKYPFGNTSYTDR